MDVALGSYIASELCGSVVIFLVTFTNIHSLANISVMFTINISEHHYTATQFTFTVCIGMQLFLFSSDS